MFCLLLWPQNKAEGAFQSGADTLSGKGHEAKRAVDDAGQDASGALRDAKKTADSKAKEVCQGYSSVYLYVCVPVVSAASYQLYVCMPL
jgi:hypothetical protein